MPINLVSDLIDNDTAPSDDDISEDGIMVREIKNLKKFQIV